MDNTPQENIKECFQELTSKVLTMLKDPDCFNYYHINDKEKDQYGNIITLIREQKLKKVDTKQLKEIAGVLIDLNTAVNMQETKLTNALGDEANQNNGVIIIAAAAEKRDDNEENCND